MRSILILLAVAACGSMQDFSDTIASDVGSFELATNAYWNNGAALPNDGTDSVNISNDLTPVLGDPRVPSLSGLVIPRWNDSTNLFADGSMSTCDVLARLVMLYATPAAGSTLVDAANAGNAPVSDILGRPRTTPDIGAVESN